MSSRRGMVLFAGLKATGDDLSRQAAARSVKNEPPPLSYGLTVSR
jgi:hypothetical protein